MIAPFGPLHHSACVYLPGTKITTSCRRLSECVAAWAAGLSACYTTNQQMCQLTPVPSHSPRTFAWHARPSHTREASPADKGVQHTAAALVCSACRHERGARDPKKHSKSEKGWSPRPAHCTHHWYTQPLRHRKNQGMHCQTNRIGGTKLGAAWNRAQGTTARAS